MSRKNLTERLNQTWKVVLCGQPDNMTTMTHLIGYDEHTYVFTHDFNFPEKKNNNINKREYSKLSSLPRNKPQKDSTMINKATSTGGTLPPSESSIMVLPLGVY